MSVDLTLAKAVGYSLTEMNFLQKGSVLLIGTGLDNIIFDGQSLRELTPPKPVFTASLDVSGGSTLTFATGVKYKFCYKNTRTGDRGPTSAMSSSTGAITTKDVVITGFTYPLNDDTLNPDETTSGAQVGTLDVADVIEIYRSLDGDYSQFFYVGEIEFPTATFTDTVLVEDIGEPSPRSGILPPMKYWVEWKGRVVAAGGFEYSTGTATVTQGSTAFTITGGTLHPRWVLAWFQIDGDSKRYTFSEYTSTTAGVLDSVYQGPSRAGATYRIYGFDSVVFFSDIDTSEQFPWQASHVEGADDDTLNFVEIGAEDGSKITGLGVIGTDVLVVFKDRSIYTITGDSMVSLVVNTVSKTVGAVAGTIARFGDGYVLFNGLDSQKPGVYITNGSAPQEISQDIASDIEGLEQTIETGFRAAVFDDYFLLACGPSGATYNNQMLKFDFREGKWCPPETRKACVTLAVVPTTTGDQLWRGDDLGRVWRDFAGDTGIDGPSVSGSVTASGSGYIQDSTKSWTTDAYKGLWFQLTDASGSTETLRCNANTSTQLTFEATFSITPVSYQSGAIDAYWKTGRFDVGGVRRAVNRRFAVQHKQAAVSSSPTFKVYADNSATAQITKTYDMSVTNKRILATRARGWSFQYEVALDAAAKPIEIHAFEVMHEISREYGEDK